MSGMYRQWAKSTREKAHTAEAMQQHGLAKDLHETADRWERQADADDIATGE